MSVIRAQVTFDTDDLLPENQVVNRLHFGTASTPATNPQLVAIVLAVRAFYSSFDQFLSPRLSGDGRIRLYDMADPEPRVPIMLDDCDITPSTSDPFPEEIALAMSFQAAAVSGENQARRRNRIFIGPVAGNAQAVVDGIARPHVDFRAAIQTGANGLLDLDGGTDGISWVVRSETTGAVAGVDNGWIDNAWDTQRRRGSSPTLRTTFAA